MGTYQPGGSTVVVAPGASRPIARGAAASAAPFWIFLGVLAALFSPVLYKLFRFSLAQEFYSHVVLIPVISVYLIWQLKGTLPAIQRGAIGPAALCACVGLFAVGIWGLLSMSGRTLSLNNQLSFLVPGFVFLLYAGAIFFLGDGFFRAALFPFLFLLWMCPFPEAVTDSLETASQLASAEVFSWMLDITQVSYLRDAQTFAMPGVTLRVAQECSGIRSSLVLLITSSLAGYMFLRSGWKRAAFTLFVIPLGLVRNAFRIWVLAILTIHWDSEVINGPLHHRGGPIFFALSLIPFFLLLFYLRRLERRGSVPVARAS